MQQDTKELLEIPDFLIRTPERQRQIEEENRRLFLEQEIAEAHRRQEQARRAAKIKAEQRRKEEMRAEGRKLREARAARREAKNSAFERVMGLAGVPFTIGRLERKLGLDRKLLLAAIRRGIKKGFIRKVSRRKYCVSS